MRVLTLRPRGGGRLFPRIRGAFARSLSFGRWSALRLVQHDRLLLPGPRWVRLEVIASGICATDLELVRVPPDDDTWEGAAALRVPGHEIVGRVVAFGREVVGLEPGARVVVDPMAAGSEAGRSLLLPGGWAEEVVVPGHRIRPVPDLDDATALLVEPVAAGVRGILERGLLREVGPIVVAGRGPVALGTIWALRALGWRGSLWAWSGGGQAASLARRLGADRIAESADDLRPGLRIPSRLPERGGGVGAEGPRPLPGPLLVRGPEVEDPFPDRPGDAEMQGMRTRRFRCAGACPVGGALRAGLRGGGGRDPFDLALKLLRRDGRASGLGELVTHAFPLSQHRDALATAADLEGSEAIRVALLPRHEGG